VVRFISHHDFSTLKDNLTESLYSQRVEPSEFANKNFFIDSAYSQVLEKKNESMGEELGNGEPGENSIFETQLERHNKKILKGYGKEDLDSEFEGESSLSQKFRLPGEQRLYETLEDYDRDLNTVAGTEVVQGFASE
jgi:hypothetical protein